MEFLAIVVIFIVLFTQRELSKKKNIAFIFIVPIILLFVGVFYQMIYFDSITFLSFVPFLIAAICQLFFGFVMWLGFRNKE